jgi:acyl carrier protein
VSPDGGDGAAARPSEDAIRRVRAVVLPSLATALGVEEELVTDDLELATLGLSSLEVMEMVYDAEDELDIVVDEDKLGDVTTVGGLVVALATDVR